MNGDITAVLDDWGRGDRSALDRLAPMVLPKLRQVAGAMLHREPRGHALQVTGLVNEVFLKLLVRREVRFQGRGHFYALAGKLMRIALVDHARALFADKRGGRAEHLPLHDELSWVGAASEDIFDLDRALTELEELDPEQVRMFEMRFLLGCSADETAALLETSKSTVDRKVRVARGWLFQRLRPAGVVGR